jgi:hypothetical protein
MSRAAKKNPQKNRFLCGLSGGIAYRDTGP